MSSSSPEARSGRGLGLDPGISRWPGSGAIIVAFSGGPDSACLLHQLAAARSGRPVRAVHVDHGLDQGSARRADHATEMAAAMGIPCRIERVQVRRSGSIEANARRARYAALSDHVGSGDVLVTAHHADDVAETVLLRLLRGSGPGGLGGIPTHRRFGAGHLIRPLLGWRREDIKTYLDAHRLRGLQDPANNLVSLDRNFLRHEIMPLLREHFPGCVQAFARTAGLNRAAGEVLAELARLDLEQAEQPGGCLRLDVLRGLAPFRRAEALRHWCIKHGHPPPPGQSLDEFMRQVEHAAGDRQPVLDWDDSRLQRHGDFLWLRSPTRKHVPWCLDWNGNSALRLPEEGGSLHFFGTLPALEMRVRSGAPGERIRLRAGAGRRAVKKILAEAGVPPWQRRAWPRIWFQDRLVAVGDRWLDVDFARLLEHHGVRLAWHPELSEPLQ
ncbi:MAG: tRNA lysidine(34) synthetase TilS [Wenzhouxiangella sp.]